MSNISTPVKCLFKNGGAITANLSLVGTLFHGSDSEINCWEEKTHHRPAWSAGSRDNVRGAPSTLNVWAKLTTSGENQCSTCTPQVYTELNTHGIIERCTLFLHLSCDPLSGVLYQTHSSSCGLVLAPSKSVPDFLRLMAVTPSPQIHLWVQVMSHGLRCPESSFVVIVRVHRKIGFFSWTTVRCQPRSGSLLRGRVLLQLGRC